MFTFSQTALKDLEKETTCPSRWNAQWLEGIISFEPNIYMERGLFFESLAIGGGAKDQIVLDLPRLRNGNKSTNQIRIEEQAENFSQQFNPTHKRFLGFTIVQTQLVLNANGKSGVIDFLAMDENSNPCIFDLKSTYNLKRGWWADIDAVDFLQQYHYHDLYMQTFSVPKGKKLRNLLAIYDYSPQKNTLITELDVTKERIKAVNERFDAGVEVVKMYKEKGWTTDPSENECKNCPLKCKDRYEEL
jgi:hypothetical protein